MAIQVRRGLSSGLVKTKLLPGEVAITTDTGELYYCASAGNVKLAATIEDVKHLLNISEESFIALQELIDTLNSDESLSTSMLSDISELKQQMQSVETTVNDTSIIFIEADEDSELTSGLSVKILFGLIKKKFNTILTKLVGKVDTSKIVNNLATTEEGFVLDARQGKDLKDAINALNNNLTSVSDNLNSKANLLSATTVNIAAGSNAQITISGNRIYYGLLVIEGYRTNNNAYKTVSLCSFLATGSPTTLASQNGSSGGQGYTINITTIGVNSIVVSITNNDSVNAISVNIKALNLSTSVLSQ